MNKIILKKDQQVFVTSDTHYNHKNICKGVSEWDISRQNNSVRDFKDLYQMNSTIVNNINAVVGEDDILIHFGDWSFGGIEQIWEFRKQIICKNIYLIFGNHDHHIFDNKILPNCHSDFVDIGSEVIDKIMDGAWENKYDDSRDDMFRVQAQDLFTWCGHYSEFEIIFLNTTPNQKARRLKFVASHYPMASWNEMGKGRIMLHGHVHLNPKLKIHQGKSMDVGVDGNQFKPYNINEIDKIMSKQPIATTELIKDHHLEEN